MDIYSGSDTQEWATPQYLYDRLAAEFSFTLDPCATVDNAKCQNFYTLADNGLAKPWAGQRVFMNPPYGRQISKWVRKAYEEVRRGGCPLVVSVLPARTDASWWHDYCMRGEIRFIRGRVRFVRDGVKAGSPAFPSAIIIFDPQTLRAPRKYGSYPLFQKTP